MEIIYGILWVDPVRQCFGRLDGGALQRPLLALGLFLIFEISLFAVLLRLAEVTGSAEAPLINFFSYGLAMVAFSHALGTLHVFLHRSDGVLWWRLVAAW